MYFENDFKPKKFLIRRSFSEWEIPLENKEKIQSNPYQWDKFGVYEKLIKTNKTHLFSYFIRRKIILFLIWVGSLLYLLTWLSYLITSYSDKSLERLITDGIIWALPAAGMIGLGAIYKPESHRIQNFILIIAQYFSNKWPYYT